MATKYYDDGVSQIVHMIADVKQPSLAGHEYTLPFVLHIAISPDMQSGTCLETGRRIEGRSRAEICERFAESMG